MASRREFLQIGVAALALPISARGISPAIAELAGEPARVPLYKVVFDERFPASRNFADEAKTLGVPVHGMKGDITDFWFNDLYHRWKQGPAAIAGLTAHGPIFCLERLAWDQRMRVVFRADHRYGEGASIEHAFSGPDSMLREAAALGSAGSDWTSRIASLVTRCPASRSQSSQSNVIASTVKHADDPDHLISWVIAPYNRA
ncbi:MAG TPA: hypothetical protein VI216_07335 [Candidatus Acidoferrales bacterium]